MRFHSIFKVLFFATSVVYVYVNVPTDYSSCEEVCHFRDTTVVVAKLPREEQTSGSGKIPDM